jgi:hypothetical protein
MPRYIIERTFPDGLAIPMTDQGAAVCLTVVSHAGQCDLDPFYVTKDKKRPSFTMPLHRGHSESCQTNGHRTRSLRWMFLIPTSINNLRDWAAFLYSS